ncbi:MAG TPA: glycosyltransferase family 4 protein [Bryobacteraceae bacterium]|nr:glycosyltransferase family 4 protein [Bryobacteraceae bacterium]
MLNATRSVGIVCHFPPPPGGMPAQAEALARGFESEGFRVRRIPTNLPGSRLDDVRGLRTLCRVPVFFFRLLAALPFVRNVHVMSCSGLSFFLFSLPAVLFGALAGKRVVLHYHGGEAGVFFRNWPRTVRFVARCAASVLVPSPFLRDVFAALGIRAAMVPNTCDAARFARRWARPNAPRFVAARHLEPVYNNACILRAFRLVLDQRPDAELWVLGGGSEREALSALAVELGLRGSIHFFGYVDNEKLPQIFGQSAYFVNASLADNQPVSILEAYAAGLPVITSPAGGIPDIVEAGRTGLFFDPRDHAELASKMLLLLAQPELARTLAENGRRKVAEFSWPAAFHVLQQAYGLPGSAAPGAPQAAG